MIIALVMAVSFAQNNLQRMAAFEYTRVVSLASASTPPSPFSFEGQLSLPIRYNECFLHLSLTISLLNVAVISRLWKERYTVILQASAALSKYLNAATLLATEAEGNVDENQGYSLLVRAEMEYNLGRLYHHLSLHALALVHYQNCLDMTTRSHTKSKSSPFHHHLERLQWCCAHNTSLIYKESTNLRSASRCVRSHFVVL